MAHKKIHPRDRKAPPSGRAMRSMAGDHEHDPKRRMGAFAGKGDHARQQQMSNKD